MATKLQARPSDLVAMELRCYFVLGLEMLTKVRVFAFGAKFPKHLEQNSLNGGGRFSVGVYRIFFFSSWQSFSVSEVQKKLRGWLQQLHQSTSQGGSCHPKSKWVVFCKLVSSTPYYKKSRIGLYNPLRSLGWVSIIPLCCCSQISLDGGFCSLRLSYRHFQKVLTDWSRRRCGQQGEDLTFLCQVGLGLTHSVLLCPWKDTCITCCTNGQVILDESGFFFLPECPPGSAQNLGIHIGLLHFLLYFGLAIESTLSPEIDLGTLVSLKPKSFTIFCSSIFFLFIFSSSIQLRPGTNF